MWAPTASTLIFGDRDAVLVDPLMTIDESRSLAKWAASYGRQITTVFITHPRGDHFFGAPAVLERYPLARVVAAPNVAAQMAAQWDAQWFDGFWDRTFPYQIACRQLVAEPLSAGALELDGDILRVIEFAHTTAAATTALHVPSINLVVAGDTVYGDVHPDLATASGRRPDPWFAALDAIDLLEPEVVVAGHKLVGDVDNPAQVDWTRCYLKDFIAAAERARDPVELYSSMVDLYPDRADRGALWDSARAFVA
jgi:glyoxylase-like metal-dependent hydrolase (beta-lactamase superfamily II)